ncbi:MAG: class I SAM-dependent methyltransferase [Myxococcales bacterium]|nr:class I SAM-dependent methyltransferase [Myxococcales bacterium]
MAPERNWDERYREDNTPWDTGETCHCLTRWFARQSESFGKVLEIGCGRGNNAIWLARQGLSVTATDVSAEAIAIAKRRADEAEVDVTFLVNDIRDGVPVDPQSIDLAFDRGVFHVFEPDGRDLFVRRLFDALRPSAHWLSIAGNADEESPEGQGPPRLSACDVVTPAEPRFSLVSLEPVRLSTRFGEPLFWQAHWRRREG